VLCSVFIPTAFISGITGTFFRQFALTIAVSTAISALNSLTLSPALAALLLKPRGAEKDSFQRILDGLLGWLFKGFNKTFAWASNAYGNSVGRLVRLAVIVLFIYAGLLGLTGLGFKIVPGGFLPTQDRGYAGLDELQTQAFAMMIKANQTPGLANNLTTFRANVPQLWLDVDRVKAKSMNVPLSNIFGTLQTYLGSTYVNDLTLFGRTYRVTAQADSEFRLKPDDIRLLKTRNNSGGIVPLGSVATVQEVSGADKITRYNMFTAADLSGQPAPGASTGDALAAVERIAKQILPSSFTTEWTEIALQQTLAGNSAIYIFPLCVLFVFLLLSALYESWSLPLAIILIVPMCLFSSIYGVWLRSMENNIFTQIGFVVLVGLACKNAILIVEFAKQIQD